MEADLVASGRFARVETIGRRSGQPRAVTVGFVDDPVVEDAVIVAAGEPGTAWAQNLIDQAACRVRIGDREFDAMAERFERGDHDRAIAAMILRYGTPAEGLGRGPAFRLRPVGANR